MAGVVLLIAIFAVRGPRPAWDGPHLGLSWNRVQQAGNASNSDEVLRVPSSGKPTLVAQIELRSSDDDNATTEAVRRALDSGDVDAACAVIQAAQNTPAVEVAIQKGNAATANSQMTDLIGAEKPARIKPKISPELQDSIQKGTTRFFSFYLYDPCAEDGDIVCLSILGEPFAMVPLTRKGSKLSIPLTSGVASGVRLLGIRDGGGGITVAVQTGDGAHICRTIAPGAELPINLAPQKPW